MRGETQEEEEMEGVQQWQQKKYFYGSKKEVKAAGGKKKIKRRCSNGSKKWSCGNRDEKPAKKAKNKFRKCANKFCLSQKKEKETKETTYANETRKKKKKY